MAKEPISEGEKEGTRPRGKALRKKESCCGRRARQEGEVRRGRASPGMERATPSRVRGEGVERSQKAASMAALNLAILSSSPSSPYPPPE